MERLGRRAPRTLAFKPAAKAGLTAADVPRLKLKWAIGFAGRQLRASAASGPRRPRVRRQRERRRLALDAKTGCTYWRYHAQAGIRTAVSRRSLQDARRRSRLRGVLRRTARAIAYAVDANTGREIWSRKLDDHIYARATGSLTRAINGRVYVPLAGVGEEGQGGSARYECCTFRGSVTALDANTGAVSGSRTRSPMSRSRAARTLRRTDVGPRGRRRLGSADDRSGSPSRSTSPRATTTPDPATMTTDAVIAMDMDTGKHSWVFQPLAERRLGRRLPAGESSPTAELPGEARARSRLLDRRRC